MLFSSLSKVAVLLALTSQAVLAAPSGCPKQTKKPSTPKKSASTPKDNSVQSQALTAHNSYRSKHHVAGLRWNQKLADHAATVTKSCVWGHNVVS